MPITDAPSPGGYIQLFGVRVSKKLSIGTVSLAAVLTLFGVFNGGQVDHYCEGPLGKTSASGGVALSCPVPFGDTDTGAILASDEQGVFINVNPDEVTKLWAGVASNATTSGSNVFSAVNFSGAKRFVSSTVTGSTLRTAGMILVGPGKSVNFKWNSTSDGSTSTGKDAGFVRFKWFNCSDISTNGRC